jgi:hypothetical protein
LLASRFSALLRVLPATVTRAHEGVVQGDPGAFAALSDVYHVAALGLMRFSAADLAFHCADRALSVGHQSGDPARIGLATQACTYALWGQGLSRAGADLACDTADTLAHDLEVKGAEGLTVAGMLHLKAAVAAADLSDETAALQLLARARAAADRIPDELNLYWTGFGVTNVLLHEASILTQLDKPGEALRAAAAIDPEAFRRLPRERRAYHHLDTARACQLTGQDDAALETLLTADRDTEGQVLCLPDTRTLISDLLSMRPAPTFRLRGIAHRCGIDV